MDHNFQHITINHCKMIEYIAMQQEQCEHFKYILRKWKWLNGFGERKRSSANDRFSSYSIEHYTGYHKFELCSVLVPSVMAVMAVAYRITFDCEFPIRKKNTYCERVSILRSNVDASEKERQREREIENDRIFRQEMPIDILYLMLSLKCVDWYFAEHIAYWWFHVITWLDIAKLKMMEKKREEERKTK